jgi:EAL domain-containing protein (putative c-di-GMP-specific phosphodiesterase class I)
MHLHRLPLDTLKLDRSFVQSVDTDADGRRLLRGLVTLCRDLGLDVVAEGIERPSQLQALRDMGCGLGQGNLIGRPAPVTSYETLLTPSAGTES